MSCTSSGRRNLASANLVDRGAHRLVIDSRSQRDFRDEVTIRQMIGRRRSHPAPLVYEHASEALLWIADAAAWCFDAGRHWRKRIEPIATTVVDVDSP